MTSKADSLPELPRAAKRLRELLEYEPSTGVFTWRSTCGLHCAGKPAGCSCEGYIYITIDGKSMKAHRLAFLYMTGALPPLGTPVDHANGVRDDNRWSNLRLATNSINNQNRRRAEGSSGFLGVSKTYNGRWQAAITVGGQRRYLGKYKTPEEAHAVYVEHKRRLHEGCTI